MTVQRVQIKPVWNWVVKGVGVSTNGALSMSVKYNEHIVHIWIIIGNVKWPHCSTHKESLPARHTPQQPITVSLTKKDTCKIKLIAEDWKLTDQLSRIAGRGRKDSWCNLYLLGVPLLTMPFGRLLSILSGDLFWNRNWRRLFKRLGLGESCTPDPELDSSDILMILLITAWKRGHGMLIYVIYNTKFEYTSFGSSCCITNIICS
jgi:hypothetical protein